MSDLPYLIGAKETIFSDKTRRICDC